MPGIKTFVVFFVDGIQILATFRFAELGLRGAIRITFRQFPLRCGALFKAGRLFLCRRGTRGFFIKCLILAIIIFVFFPF
jgi:hypothetical protein